MIKFITLSNWPPCNGEPVWLWSVVLVNSGTQYATLFWRQALNPSFSTGRPLPTRLIHLAQHFATVFRTWYSRLALYVFSFTVVFFSSFYVTVEWKMNLKWVRQDNWDWDGWCVCYGDDRWCQTSTLLRSPSITDRHVVPFCPKQPHNAIFLLSFVYFLLICQSPCKWHTCWCWDQWLACYCYALAGCIVWTWMWNVLQNGTFISSRYAG